MRKLGCVSLLRVEHLNFGCDISIRVFGQHGLPVDYLDDISGVWAAGGCWSDSPV